MKPVRIGTRGSALALWQARAVAARLEDSGRRTEIIPIRTSGDEGSAPSADPQPSVKRLFVKEIEDALLRGEIDVAVHSAKDMSSSLPDGLAIAAVLPREDPLDAIVLPRGSPALSFDEVAADVNGYPRDVDGRSAEGPEIGTTSVRRIAQLATVFPGATFAPIRGNVDTRLRKLDSGAFTAIVLAAAGLRRLDLADRITAAIPLERCVPAPGQGTVAIEIRIDDADTRSAVSGISHSATAATLSAERAVVRALGGGCQLPLGALALHEDGGLRIEAVVASPDGARIVRCGLRGPGNDPEALGLAAARELTRGGAMEILDAVRVLE